jgi:hypothetical protein
MKKKLVTAFSLVAAAIVGTIMAVRTPPKMAFSASTTPIIPVSWTTPAWFIDPANSSGTASDSNNCTTSGTACLTWHEINDHRWGCQGSPVACPRLQQNTTITWLSGNSTAADPVYFLPALESGAWAWLKGTLPTGTAGTLASVTNGGATTRSTLFLASVTGGSPAAGTFLVNSTHAGAAWGFKVSSGAIWKWSQPLGRAVIPQAFVSPPTELTNWANGDSVTLYTPINVNVVRVQPTATDSATGSNNFVYLTGMNAPDISGTNTERLMINQAVSMEEFSSAKSVIVEQAAGPQTVMHINDYTINGINGRALQSYDIAGILGSAWQSSADGLNLDGDIIITNGLFLGDATYNIEHRTTIGAMYVDTSQNIWTYALVSVPSAGIFDSIGIIWGPGTFNVTSSGHVSYNNGAGKAAATFTIASLGLSSGGRFCVGNPSNSLTTSICNIALTAANLDANLGATVTGCAGFIGGGGYCNTGE